MDLTKVLKSLLVPLVPVYALMIKVRNLFFNISVFKSEKVNAKIISVGNITVGGSGKTPMVIYVTKLLKQLEHKVGVLSRGYGRKSSGYRLVSMGDKVLISVDECGDEIYHTSLECKVAAAVSENRVIGAKRLIEDAGVSTIVLDDAYQHRWLARDVDIVIIDQSFINDKSFFNHNLLPTGNLREGFCALDRADAIIINRKFFDKKEINPDILKYFNGKNVFTSYYKAYCFVDVMRKIEYSLDEFKGQESLVISGIANPQSFLSALEKVHVNTYNRIIFKDHKNYTLKEVKRIRKEFYSTNSHSVVTTEKDAVKLSKFSREFDDIDMFFLKINLCMDDEESFIKYLINKLNKNAS
jgi:tetraacyldisaccharide 4'-kinase